MDLSIRFRQFEKNLDCILNFVLFGSVFARIDNYLNCLCETVPINHTLWLIQTIFFLGLQGLRVIHLGLDKQFFVNKM